MKVIFIGLPYFSQRLARKLSAIDPANKYISLDTNSSKKDQLKYLSHLPTTDLVFSIGGSTVEGGAFKMARKFKKKLLIYWAGSDVLKAQKEQANNQSNEEFINYCSHYCCADWFENELQELSIDSQTLYIASASPRTNFNWPKGFSVLTYIGKDKPEFYGLNKVLATAELLPAIPFYLVGIDQLPSDTPQNVKAIGYVENFEDEIEKHPVFLRIPEHDGLGFSVIEALGLARHVIRSDRFPHTLFANSTELIAQQLIPLYQQFNEGNLKPNMEGRDFVIRNFEEGKIYQEILKTIQLEVKG